MRKVFKGYFLLICGELHQKRLYLVWNNFLLGDRVVRPVQRSPIAIRRVLHPKLRLPSILDTVQPVLSSLRFLIKDNLILGKSYNSVKKFFPYSDEVSL